jgi:DNA modification methylase
MRTESVSIEQITVPDKRFRPVTGRAEGIAESMLKFGQLQPIIIDSQYNLVDGLHRLEAVRMNGQTHIDCVFKEEADPIFLREVELEVNIMREEMTWQEKQAAIAELHSLKSDADPDWTQTKTAAVIGSYRHADVSNALKLEAAMKLFPELATAKSTRQALRWAERKAKGIHRVLEVQDSEVDYSDIESKILLGDSVELIKGVPDESFDAIITDPPFGIRYDDRVAGSGHSTSSYEDSETSYLRLLTMVPDLYRTLKPDGWCVWFLGITWYERAKVAFREAGFRVDECPIIWDRSGGHTLSTVPDKWFAKAYDIALHCAKGDPNLALHSHNIIKVDPVEGDDRELLVERPVELYGELIKRLTIAGESVADFFVGSGSCPAAAAGLGRDFFGCELDPVRRAHAIKKIKAWTIVYEK